VTVGSHFCCCRAAGACPSRHRLVGISLEKEPLRSDSGIRADRKNGGFPARTRGLDRHIIPDAGAAFIEMHGLQELSMGRLGAYLGVEAMSLYLHVPSRDNLWTALWKSFWMIFAAIRKSIWSRWNAGRTTCSAWPGVCAGWHWPARRSSP